MEAGKANVSFYNEKRRAVRISAVTLADGSVKADVASLTLKDGNRLMDAIQVAALDETVKYLKIEGAGNGLNAYRLGMLA